MRPVRGRAARPVRLVPGRHRSGRGRAAARSARRPRPPGDRRGGRGGPGPAAGADRRAAPQRARPARDAGSDGSEEWEIQALLGPVYDIHRLGVFFTASPRHADVLLVTGAGAWGMSGPLRTTYDGMPDPKVVIAVGTDAVSGGLLSESEVGHQGRRRHGAGRCLAAGLPAQSVRHPQCPADRGRLATAEADERAVRGRADPAGAGGRGVGRFQRSWPYLLGAAGSACLAVLGGFALAGRTVRLDVAGWLGNPVPGQQAAALGADRLSGLFLALSFGAAVPVSVAFASWAARAAVHAAVARRQLRAGARRGRGDHDRAGRLHRAVRLGDADARLLPAV